MPELPEVESVRRGLADLVTGRRVVKVVVRHPRLLRGQPEGPAGFAALVSGAVLGAPRRRGKFLWLPLLPGGPGGPDSGGEPDRARALVVHLGMSGQLRVVPTSEPHHPHTRVVFRLDGGRELRAVDMRMFGRLAVDDLVPTPGTPDPEDDQVPALAAHIARDPLDPHFEADAFVARLRARRTEVKRALLDQRLVSGVGNIYADESLWRARLHWARRTETLTRASAATLVSHVQDVLQEAIADGGTSFDALYVDVNGSSGYYDRRLAVYGREGEPCPACGAPVRRDAWTNRSAFSCPRCQRPPQVSEPRRGSADSATAGLVR